MSSVLGTGAVSGRGLRIKKYSFDFVGKVSFQRLLDMAAALSFPGKGRPEKYNGSVGKCGLWIALRMIMLCEKYQILIERK